MHNKLQYPWRGDYCQCVQPVQLPILTWSSSSFPLGTISTIRSPPGARRLQLLRSSKWYDGAIRKVCIHLIISERPSFFSFLTRQVFLFPFSSASPCLPLFSLLSLCLYVFLFFISFFYLSCFTFSFPLSSFYFIFCMCLSVPNYSSLQPFFFSHFSVYNSL